MPLTRQLVNQCVQLNEFDCLVFAGGGNRCWWQAGLAEVLRSRGWRLPEIVAGTSAGAAVAAAVMGNATRAALQGCLELYRETSKICRWSWKSPWRLKFAHESVYPRWIRSFVDASMSSNASRCGSRLQVAVTRVSRRLGVGGSLAAGYAAYCLDKYTGNRLHSGIAGWFGLQQEFIDVDFASDCDATAGILVAAAASPPMMPMRMVAGRPALDGGYVDSAPIPPGYSAGNARTLVLLTRRYPSLPTHFRRGQVQYWQPGAAVPVSTWRCTADATVEAAFEFGRQEALRHISAGNISVK